MCAHRLGYIINNVNMREDVGKSTVDEVSSVDVAHLEDVDNYCMAILLRVYKDVNDMF